MSTSARYVTVAAIRNAKYDAGSLVKPRSAAAGVTGDAFKNPAKGKELYPPSFFTFMLKRIRA